MRRWVIELVNVMLGTGERKLLPALLSVVLGGMRPGLLWGRLLKNSLNSRSSHAWIGR